MSLDRQTKWWRGRVFLATGACYGGLYFCRKPFYVAKASLEDAWGWDPEVLGWLGLAYLVAYSAGQFLSAWTGTRFGPRRVLLVGMGLSILCNVVFGFTSMLWLFAAFMVINGFAQATGWANVVGTMGSWFRRRERGTVMGVWGINYQLGSIGANALAATSPDEIARMAARRNAGDSFEPKALVLLRLSSTGGKRGPGTRLDDAVGVKDQVLFGPDEGGFVLP